MAKEQGNALTSRALATLGALAFLAHAGALGAGFVFDDRGAIQENPVVKGPLDLGALFSTDFWGRPPGEGPGTWRPLVVLSFWLNEHVFGGFHETNLLLHVATVIALALALFRQTQRRTFALVAAAVFGALGIHTEAVVGLVGRADVMAAGLCFFAWYLLGRPDEPAPEKRALSASLAFAGAVLCKESAVVFPLLVVLADWLLAEARRAKAAIEPRRYVALGLAAVAMVGLRVAAFGSPFSVQREIQANPLLAEGLGARLFTSLALFGMAVRRIVVPVGLSADYSYAAILPEKSPLSLAVIAGAAALVFVVVLAVRVRRSEPLLALAAVMLVVPWLVVSQLPFRLPTIFAERLLYLPASGFALGVAWLVEASFQKGKPEPARKEKSRGAKKRTDVKDAPLDPARVRRAAMLLGPVLVVNIALAWQRAKVWKDDRSLFEAALEVVPGSARAQHNYGSALLNEGKASLSIPYFERASEILPTWSEPHAQLGVAFFEEGRAREAEAHFLKAVELEPDAPKAVFNLAVFLARAGRLDEAKVVLVPFVQKHPGNAREASLLRQVEAGLAEKPSPSPR